MTCRKLSTFTALAVLGCARCVWLCVHTVLRRIGTFATNTLGFAIFLASPSIGLIANKRHVMLGGSGCCMHARFCGCVMGRCNARGAVMIGLGCSLCIFFAVVPTPIGPAALQFPPYAPLFGLSPFTRPVMPTLGCSPPCKVSCNCALLFSLFVSVGSGESFGFLDHTASDESEARIFPEAILSLAAFHSGVSFFWRTNRGDGLSPSLQ